MCKQVCKCNLLCCGEHELTIRRERETILDISVSICIEKSIFLTTLLQNIYERNEDMFGVL